MNMDYHFRIIPSANGEQVIDYRQPTPLELVPPILISEYEELENQLFAVKLLKMKKKRKNKNVWNKLCAACHTL
jgi:hypothetical protein